MSKLWSSVVVATKNHAERLREIGGCSDGFCMVTGTKARGTMVTNGGCRCPNDNHKMRRVAMSMHELQKELKAAIEADD